MKTKLILIMLLTLILPIMAMAVQPTQQYNKLYLNPYYQPSMALNTNYTFTVTVNPPDGVGTVSSAIIGFNGQINGQTQTFYIWVNGQPCTTSNYSVATAYSTTGNVQFSFDCTNRITTKGIYNVTLRSAVNTGAMSGWLELTYMNNPKGSADIFGTEYVEGDAGTVFLLLKDSSGEPVSNATCTIDVYYPNIANQTHPEWINNGLMMYKEEGLYYYDLTIPALTGLYMVNAQCSYITDNNYYYTLASGKSVIRNVTTGTYVGDTFVLNDYGEWLYTQCDSGTAGGGGKACDASYQWNLTGVNATALYVTYLGENNGANLMVMYYWNWTSNAWVALPNNLTFKATGSSGVPIGVDEYLSNSLPLGAKNSSNGLLRIRLYTTGGSTFKQWDNWLSIKTSQVSTTIQDLKGSGEIHVSGAAAGLNRWFSIDSCDGFIDGRCAQFTNDGEFDLAEGELEDFINVTSTNTKMDNEITIETPFTVDCTALYWVKQYNGSAWVDFTDYTVYSQPALENCEIIIHQDMQSGTQYQYWIKMDNFMKWEVTWSKSMLDSINNRIRTICSGRNFTYTTPITETTNLSSDPVTSMCHQAYDDMYWSGSYYNDSLLINLAGEYASYIQELRYYRGAIEARYAYLELGNQTPYMSDYYAQKVWNHTTRNLTYYPTATVNSTDIANNVWNATNRNLTYYNMTDTTNYTLIQTVVWNATNRNLTYFPTQVDMTNYSLIATLVWNYSSRNLTYFPVQLDLTNYTLIQLMTWNATNRNLTYYPAQTDLTNYGLIQTYVWNATNRNLTYYPAVSVDTGAIALAVWNYTTRNLTYFPTQVDLTNYALINSGVWSYASRNLTYYPAQTDMTNYSAIESGVWSYTNRNLTYFPTQTDMTNYTLINNGVWSYANRTLTYYPTQTDLTNYSAISQGVWNYTTRDLTYYQVNNLSAADVWTYINRTLTYYEVNNISATDVWAYNNRTLTYYPSQSDLTNYTAIWTYPDRNLTYYAPTQVNASDIAENVWNASARYTHGVILN